MTRTPRWLGRPGLVIAALLVVTSLASAPPANAAPVISDRTGDAHPNLDIQRVRVLPGPRSIVVKVKVRRLGVPDSRRLTSQVGVHFDTGGRRKPNHLVRIDGMHWAAGSTRTWNRLRPNGWGDPWGDWINCYPANWRRPLIRFNTRAKLVIFTAPRSCLRHPRRIRVAVQSYRSTRPHARGDWLRTPRSYTRWVR